MALLNLYTFGFSFVEKTRRTQQVNLLVKTNPTLLSRSFPTRLASDHPAPRAPAFFSSELLPVEVGELGEAGGLELARGPKQLDEELVEDENEKEDGEGTEEEAGKEKEENKMVGRAPRLLVIDDLGVEGSSDDEELDHILEDLLKEEESSGVTTEEHAETSSELDKENSLMDEGLPPKKPMSSEDESEEKEKTKEAEKDDSAATSRKTTPSTERTKDKDFAEEDGEDEAEVIPLEGIKTILVVTKNTSKSDAGEKEPSERISEAELNSDIVLVDNEMEVK